ncbi:MAG: 3' terminal RNA ribose 2'-O-methyltransferase Hen1 [Lysobacterales bacterium 69-70]|nr:3' terminal RNA ribose 2'-O-methyltransferase Hen1 [Xanthomonadaceae bacterium]ODU32875.1 MAG: 3' terminal RNA ribose 2'-O-methyltransferase Hen1 [Xanthomonadaceae bacterium SCN 69-320]OJZ00497.1 MAG: 3' terminal RNA ribose 2'-O-methyltransferase Hen1 [Xanthomonadales bacterium 69-70]
MLLNLTTTHEPATDLGYLLAKHPQKLQSFELAFGRAQVFYPQADAQRCTASLLLDIDPVGLVRGRGDGSEGPLAQYVNDRPYAASSFLAVAIARVYRSALAGASADRDALAQTPIPLEAEVPVLRARGGEDAIRRCFEPLGYAVQLEPLALDARFPEWGASPYWRLRISGCVRLRELLSHLYVLLPAIDGDKHYFVGDDEVDKLVAKAGDWLAAHPQRDWIANRYLKRRRSLVRSALARLLGAEEDEVDRAEQAREAAEEAIERPLSLNEQRMGSVLSVLRQSGARKVVDLGCGEGRLLGLLLKEKQFEGILGIDVSLRALDIAADRLHLERLPPSQRARLQLAQGALTYRDRRFEGFDAACAIEVIEHMDPPRLPAFVRNVFEFARPGLVVVTTPNAEYNALFADLPAGRMRHPDHRFEWTRAEFQAWAEAVASRHGYGLRLLPVGPLDPLLGAPTQMALFTRDA